MRSQPRLLGEGQTHTLVRRRWHGADVAQAQTRDHDGFAEFENIVESWSVELFPLEVDELEVVAAKKAADDRVAAAQLDGKAVRGSVVAGLYRSAWCLAILATGTIFTPGVCVVVGAGLAIAVGVGVARSGGPAVAIASFAACPSFAALAVYTWGTATTAGDERGRSLALQDRHQEEAVGFVDGDRDRTAVASAGAIRAASAISAISAWTTVLAVVVTCCVRSVGSLCPVAAASALTSIAAVATAGEEEEVVASGEYWHSLLEVAARCDAGIADTVRSG